MNHSPWSKLPERTLRIARRDAGTMSTYGEMPRMLTETIASGMGSRPNDNVQKVTGEPPIKFADFVRRTAQAWT
jgi:hypothetical protein